MATLTDGGSAGGSTATQVRFEHSRDFPDLLSHLGVSVVVSTYQAGKVFVLGGREGKIALTFHNFEQPMGMAIRPGCLAIGTRRAVYYLHAAHELAPRIEPMGQYQGAFLTRCSHFTGTIHCHDLAWCGEELWVTNTLFSCLCTLRPEYHFVPGWRPPFITGLAPQDRCHLNGLAADGEKPRYVTVLACTDTPEGWRPNKAKTGCLLEVPSGNVVVEGVCMPHSPRLYGGKLWVLNSGLGNLSLVDVSTGKLDEVARVPGYTRGLAFHGPYAFVGLSRIRETNVFGGLPIAEKRDELVCGIGVVEWATGRTVATFMLRAGVEEIYDVQVVPLRSLALSGPHPDIDGSPVIWVVPPA